MIHFSKKSLFLKATFAFTSLGIFFVALAIMRMEVPIPPTPLVESVTTETAKPALLANEDLLTPQDKLSTQTTKKTRPTTSSPKPTPQVKAQNVIEPTKSCGGNFTQEFVCLLNDYRTSKGVSRLSYANDLAKVAQSYSDWMSASVTFSHIDANGNNFVGRCAVAGITCYAENLATGFTSASNLLSMWQASPSHDENLLRNLTSVGLGIKNGYATLLMR